MKKIIVSLLAGIGLAAASVSVAQAAPCRDYTRTVYFGGGVPYAAAGTACLGGDGVWRIAAEHLTGPEAVLVPNAPTYVAAQPVVYAAPYYAPYAYPAPYFYNPSFVSFGFGYYGGGHRGGHYHHR